MKNITHIQEEKFDTSLYIKPRRFRFFNDGKETLWDFIESKDSVSILLYHEEKESFIFVKQFRIALWFYQKNDPSYKKDENMGFSIELCSGLVDKNLELEKIAEEECVEELGYLPQKLEKIREFYSGFGNTASKQSLYFARVSEKDKVAKGGGIDNEVIEAVFVKPAEYEDFSKNIIRSSSLDFAYLWFMKNIRH